jgi:hypothetical protein
MLVNTGSGARLKNVARLRDIIVNWCTGGCWFTLAEWTHGLARAHQHQPLVHSGRKCVRSDGRRHQKPPFGGRGGGLWDGGRGEWGQRLTTPKHLLLGGGWGGRAEWGQQLTTPRYLIFGAQEGNCEGGLCDRCPAPAPAMGNLLGFSYGWTTPEPGFHLGCKSSYFHLNLASKLLPM